MYVSLIHYSHCLFHYTSQAQFSLIHTLFLLRIHFTHLHFRGYTRKHQGVRSGGIPFIYLK